MSSSDNSLPARAGSPVPRRILIAGGSGLIGRALAGWLRSRGDAVSVLVRRPPAGPDEIAWHPNSGELDRGALEGFDAVVNLSGANVAAGRWTHRRRDAILHSRVNATRTLVSALGQCSRPSGVLVNASAIGIYGDRGDEVLTESSGAGSGFLADVCRAWEADAAAANAAGIRTCCLRFGVVLAADGGALAKLRPVFRAGLGGRIGDGRQWMSWISLEDTVGAIAHAILQPACRGPVNVVSPQPVTNAEFTRVLARALHRPALLPVPAAVLRLVLGELADATLLASERVLPTRLAETGYAFRHPTLDLALQSALG